VYQGHKNHFTVLDAENKNTEAIKEYITMERNDKDIKDMQRLSKDGYMFRTGLFLAQVSSQVQQSCTALASYNIQENFCYSDIPEAT
jgi:hypothetical protein